MKKVNIIILALVMLAGSASAASAEFPLVSPMKTKAELNADAAKALQAARCAKIQEKIAAKSVGFDENKDRHYNAYKNLRDRMEKLVARLEAKGYDVADLKDDLSVLDTKIQKFADDYVAYQAKLGETKDYACGHSNGEFKTKLQEARAFLRTVREDSKDIKSYYLNTIKPELKEIRKQKVEDAESE